AAQRGSNSPLAFMPLRVFGPVGLLALHNVSIGFGGVVALGGISFDVDRSEIVGLIGPNGAGKTTAFNVITRLYRPDSGDVVFDGRSLLRIPAHRVVTLGIARTFQNVELFPTMTVRENVLVGAHTVSRFEPERSVAAKAQGT